MSSLRHAAAGFRSLLRRARVDRELDEELRVFLEMAAEDKVRQGAGPRDARRAVRLERGSLDANREVVRAARWEHVLETWWRDFGFAFRTLGANPGFTAVAVLTLALGIGANTAIFSVVYAVLVKPLPYAQSDRLVNVFQARPQDRIAGTGWSYANFVELRDRNRVFTDVAGSQRHQLTLTGRGDPSVVNTSVVTPEFFRLFGEAPLAGRTLRPDDGEPGAPPVVVLSEALWRGVFGADPAAVGSSVDLDARSFTVVGIMPATFRFPRVDEREQLWIPLVQDPLFGGWMARRAGHWLQVTGRLKPGVSPSQAREDMEALGSQLAGEYPAENGGWLIRMVPLQRMIVGNVRSALLMLMGAVGLVLVIACANISNLFLTRATSRAREIAVRSALGAGRLRIVQQLLCETAALGLLGGVIGVALAWWGVQGLGRLLPASVPRVNDIRVDRGVLAFALALSGFVSGAIGCAAATFLTTSGSQARLRESGGRASESGAGRRVRRFLAAGEIALAVVLLVAAGLLLRSFSKLLSIDPGFAVQDTVKAEVSLPQARYSTPQQWVAFSDALLARIHAEPGLRRSALAVPLPLADGNVNLAFDIVGHPAASAGASRTANYASVSPEYFRVLGIPLLAGRIFTERDRLSAPRVTIITQALARIHFPHQDPLGQQLTFGFPPGSGGAAREIVGVVGDVRDVSLSADPGPMMYVPYAQAPFWGAGVVVRSTLSPSAVAAAIRHDVAALDSSLPVSDISTMTDVVDLSVAEPRARALLLTLFAAMALILAATGIFGVIAYSVACRTHEIGIRIALGASRGTILRMVSRETLVLTATGLALGLAAAIAAARLLGYMLFGVTAYDPATLLAVAATLAAVAAAAAYVPARRAVRVDPLVALRHD